MNRGVVRRAFLKSAPAAAGIIAYAAQDRVTSGSGTGLKAADVRISSVAYKPVADYPIQPKSYREVTLRDGFWKPKVTTNAEVTIPFEIQKLTGSESTRGLNGGVLEAAILSLQTHADPKLQAQVDARVETLRKAPHRGNSGFEVAAAYYFATGKRDLLDMAIPAADALYEDFKLHSPPFSGGERDAVNCVQLYRATKEKRYLDLAKHYLDIRIAKTEERARTARRGGRGIKPR